MPAPTAAALGEMAESGLLLAGAEASNRDWQVLRPPDYLAVVAWRLKVAKVSKVLRLPTVAWQVLRRVKGSVLWLLEMPAAAEPRLRAQALAAGLDPARLLFSPLFRSSFMITSRCESELELQCKRDRGIGTG